MKQTTFASLAFAGKKKRTRRETCLAGMERKGAPLIDAPIPTKNKQGARNPEMSSTKMCNV